VDAAKIVPANFTAERWNYRRSAQYGSPHLRLDGQPGQERMTSASAYASQDRRAIFIGVPEMKAVMQMTLAWELSSNGVSMANQAAFTIHELIPFDPVREGFGELEVDLTPRTQTEVTAHTQDAVPSSVSEGRKLYETMGCSACHSTDGTMQGKVGPSWRGLAGSRREMADGSILVSDEAYLKESILRPAAKVPKGFESLDAGMPIYEGVLTAEQVQSLVLFIQSLRDTAPKPAE